MKKFIKKTLAGLIAGVMAVSSMPFVALADEYSDFNTMKSQMASFTAYQPSAHGSFSGDADYTNYEDHYKGLVYAEDVKDYSGTGSVKLGSSITGSSSTYANIYFPTSVALYNGSNEITVPIMISASTAQSGMWSANFRPQAGVISGDGLSFVNSTWNGKDEKDGGSKNCYANGNQTSNLPSLNFMSTINLTSYTLNTTASQGVNKNIDPGYGRKAEIFANKVKVTPSFDDNTTVTLKNYNPSVRFYVSAGDKDFDGGKYIDLTSSDAVTVINYQPYLNKLATVKSDVASMDATKYTAASVKAYVDACDEFLNIDPSTYSYSTDTNSAVNSLVTAMNKAMTDYDSAKNALEVKKYTYTFIKADGTKTTVEAQDDSAAYFWGVTAGNVPNTANTQKTYAGNKQHKWVEYSWPTSATNYQFVEISTEKFEACNVVDGKCTICGESFIDYSVFDAAVAEAEALDNSKGVYSDESFAAYQAKVAEIKAKRDTVASQDELDALITELATASDLLVKTTFTVKFVTVDGNGNESTVEEKTFKYGESYAPTSDKNVEKWVVTTDNGNTTTKLNTYETSVTIIITKDAVVYAYQTDDAQAETSSKVTFYGKNGQIVAVKYVAEGEKLETSTVDVPEIPFYTAKGWDTETVTGTGSAISVKAVYESTATEDDMCTVHFGDWSKAYSYDSYVYLPNADTSKKYALYDENDNLLTYLDGVDFYAPKRANIYVKEVTGEVAASIGITGSFSQRTSTTKSAVYNCKFYLPEGATAVEWGLEVTINGKTAKVKGETKSERNEYSIRLNAPLSSSIDSVDGRAYVTYKTADGTPTTIYSSSVNQTL